jgi:hypothetical protein
MLRLQAGEESREIWRPSLLPSDRLDDVQRVDGGEVGALEGGTPRGKKPKASPLLEP